MTMKRRDFTSYLVSFFALFFINRVRGVNGNTCDLHSQVKSSIPSESTRPRLSNDELAPYLDTYGKALHHTSTDILKLSLKLKGLGPLGDML